MARPAWIALLATIASSASAQRAVPLDLVRCAAPSDAPCLRPRTGDARSPVFGVGVDGVAGLARTTAARTVGTEIVFWRPPLLAMPAFRGIADSAALGPGVREAALLGTGVGSDRPSIALLVLLVLGFAWFMVIQIGRTDDDEPAVVESSTTTRTGAASDSGEEAPPRKPGDVTRHTARRTALGR